MRRWLGISAAAVVALLWGQWQFISGFDDGSGTALCVVEHFQTEKLPREIAVCRDVDVNSPQMKLLRLYREAVGDAVQFENGRPSRQL